MYARVFGKTSCACGLPIRWTLCGTLLVIVAPFVAMAQEQTSAAQTTQVAQAQSGAGAPTEATQGAVASHLEDQLAEVIVTAERRATDVEKTPVAVETATQDELVRAGADQLTDLGKIMSDVSIPSALGAAEPSIRGVIAGPSDPSGESNNAVYVDGVILDKLRGMNGFFYDISSVEVDKGPQGTLFGRDSTGGAIVITTNAPVLGNLSAAGELEGGSYDTQRATGYINVPITDTLAARGAFLDYSHNGYMLSGTDLDSQQSGRVSLLWQPDDAESLELVVDSSLETGGNETGNIVGVEPGITDIYVPSNPRDDTFYAGREKSGTTPYAIRTRQQGILLQNIYDFSSVTWTTLLAHRHMDQGTDTYPYSFGQGAPEVAPNGLTYPGGAPSYTPQQYSAYSLESRVNSRGSTAWQWVAGIYADKYTDGGSLIDYNSPYTTNAPIITIAEPYQVNKSWAGFAQGTYSPHGVFTGLHLTLGGRLTEEVKSATNTYTQFGSLLPYASLVPYVSGRWGSGTYRAAVAYDLTNTSMLYADTATGFSAGGIGYGPGINPAVGPLFRPQKNTAYEFGSKNRFLNNTLQVNVEAWRYDYKDFLNGVTYYGSLPGGGYGGLPILTLENAGQATFKGATLDVQYLITPDDRVKLNFSDFYGKYGAYLEQAAPGYSFTPGPTLTSSETNLMNQQIAGVPKWVGYVQYMHTWRNVLGGSLNAEVDTQLRGRDTLGTTFDPTYGGNVNVTQGSWVDWNASLQYQPKNEIWSVTVYGHNLTNGLYAAMGSESAATHAITETFLPPRTIGVILAAKFN
jgi:iron complex outermembrane receptor protein